MNKKLLLKLGAITTVVAPVAAVVSCSVAQLPNPNKTVPTIQEIQAERPGFGEIGKIDTSAPKAEKLFEIAAAFYSDWKWITFYLGNEPEKEKNFILALSEINFRTEKLSSTPELISLTKEAWGNKIWQDRDPDREKVLITKPLFVSFLKDQLGKHDSGYDWFIEPIIKRVEEKL